MRSFFSSVLLLLTAVALPRVANALELPQLAERARPSVVLLTISDEQAEKAASGTGFFVSKDGRIVTNHHVIEHAVKVTATLAERKESRHRRDPRGRR